MKILSRPSYFKTQTIAQKLAAAKNMHIKLPNELDVFGVKDSKLKQFAQKCVKMSPEELFDKQEAMKDEFIKYRNESLQEKSFREFFRMMETFADDFSQKDSASHKKMASLFYSILAKGCMKIGDFKEAVPLLKRSVEILESADDKISQVRSLNTLISVCDQLGENQELYNSLKKLNITTKAISNNYSQYHKKYLEKGTTPMTAKDAALMRAYVCSRLASMTSHASSEVAKKYVLQAASIYKENGMRKEYEFALNQLKRTRSSLLPNKLKFYKPEDKARFCHDKFFFSKKYPENRSNDIKRYQRRVNKLFETQGTYLKNEDKDKKVLT